MVYSKNPYGAYEVAPLMGKMYTFKLGEHILTTMNISVLFVLLLCHLQSHLI